MIHSPPPLTRIDREMVLNAGNWPDVKKQGWESVTVTWMGFVELPDTAPAGKYSFKFENEKLAGKVMIESAMGIIAAGQLQGIKQCADVSGETIVCVEKPSASLSFPIKVVAENLGPTFDLEDSLKFVYTIGLPDGSTTASEVVPGSWLRLSEEKSLKRSVDSADVPDARKYVKGVGQYKGQPYLDASVVVVNRVLAVVITAAIAFASGGRAKLNACFDAKNIALFAPCAVCYAIADIAEILANGAMDPTVYIILSQSRLLLTALTLKLWMGTSHTTLQWIDLADI